MPPPGRLRARRAAAMISPTFQRTESVPSAAKRSTRPTTRTNAPTAAALWRRAPRFVLPPNPSRSLSPRLGQSPRLGRSLSPNPDPRPSRDRSLPVREFHLPTSTTASGNSIRHGNGGFAVSWSPSSPGCGSPFICLLPFWPSSCPRRHLLSQWKATSEPLPDARP